MINLSKKAASRFNYRWADLNEQSGDYWKIDTIMVSRFPVLLIIHEYTLYTLVRCKSDFKSFDAVVNEIRQLCPWYRYKGQVNIGKNLDRKLNGSINEIKRMSAGDYSENFTEEIEVVINDCIYSYLSDKKYGYGNPLEAAEKYIQGKWPVQL